jgi:hypothetical protein
MAGEIMAADEALAVELRPATQRTERDHPAPPQRHDRSAVGDDRRERAPAVGRAAGPGVGSGGSGDRWGGSGQRHGAHDARGAVAPL